MNKFLTLIKKNLFFLLIIFLSFSFFYLKSIGYYLIPENNIFDERNYALSGYSFRKTLIPIGWSNMGPYGDLSRTKDRGGLNHVYFASNGVNLSVNGIDPNIYNKDYFKYPLAWTTELDFGKGKEHIVLVQPFLDHPILGSLIYSLNTKNISSFEQIQPFNYRYIAIIISFITGIILYLVGKCLYNKWIGLISFLIYSTAPIFILTSRYALLENILIPLFLLTVLLNYFYSKKQKSFYLIIIGIICGLSFLVKESGLFILLYSILINIKNKLNIKKYFKIIVPFSILVGIYYLYSIYLSSELTFKLLFAQSQRNFYGPLSLIGTLFQPGFNKFPIEGYWIFGFISLLFLITKKEPKYDFLKFGFISYSAVYLLLGSLNYPWYSLPFIPIIVISSGIFIYEAIINNNIFQKIIILLIPVSSSFFWGYLVSNNQVNLYRLFVLFLSIVILIKSKKISNILFILTLLFVIGLNYRSVQYLITNWKNIPTQYLIKTYE